MSLLLDANLLVYATMDGMAEHEPVRTWLVGRYQDPNELVGVAWSSLYGLARLITSPRIMGDDAVGPAVGWSAARAYLEQDRAHLVQAGRSHAAIASELMSTPGLSSDDVPDVQLAALAIEHGLTLCTHDHGFGRFDRLAWYDPLDA